MWVHSSAQPEVAAKADCRSAAQPGPWQAHRLRAQPYRELRHRNRRQVEIPRARRCRNGRSAPCEVSVRCRHSRLCAVRPGWRCRRDTVAAACSIERGYSGFAKAAKGIEQRQGKPSCCEASPSCEHSHIIGSRRTPTSSGAAVRRMMIARSRLPACSACASSAERPTRNSIPTRG